MAKFTRAGIREILGDAHTEELENRLIALHLAVVDPMKDELQTLRQQAAEAEAVTKERDELKSKGGDAAKVKAEFDAFRQQVETERINGKKTAAVRRILKDGGVQRDEFVELLLGKVNLDDVEMDGDAVKAPDTLVAALKQSYGGCFGEVKDVGTPAVNPPSGGKTYTASDIKKMTPAQINENWNAIRQALPTMK